MQLILGVHCHQPLGNFDFVIDEACRRGYLPFIEMLARHPEIPINLHYSGCLLEWLEDHRPDVIEELAGLGDQVEWMTGGFYEPIFPIIPPEDRLAQIELLTGYIRERFDQEPQGMWLPERVWDPTLPASLVAAGVRYLPLDDQHFLAGGYPPDELTGYFATDYLGNTVAVFPISQRLRYTIPFEEPKVTIEHLRRLNDRHPGGLAVMADDGEKFGVWPGTHQWVYGPQGWLDRFFRALGEEEEWLQLTTFERYLADHPPRGTVALPPSSYFEMTEWALPAASGARFAEVVERLEAKSLWDESRSFLRGGYWPNFQVKYPESNAMYRKMLRLSDGLRRSKKVPAEARRQLLAAQCNCSYWHGVFGGLYLAHIRADVHQRLITARTLLDQATHRSDRWSEVEVLDWDGDGEDEVAVELPEQSWVLDPGEGGSLHFFDDKPARWSVSDVVARRFEAYHPSLAETSGIAVGDHAAVPRQKTVAPKLVYDRHSRRWLTDHLLPPGISPQQFADVAYEELLPLAQARYGLEQAKGGRGGAAVSLEVQLGTTSAHKSVRAKGRLLRVAYRLAGFPEGRFGPELPISVWEEAGRLQAEQADWLETEEPLQVRGRRFTFRHEGRKTVVTIELDRIGALYAVPLRTISKSEAGYDRIMQGVILWPHWEVEGEGRYRLKVEVSHE
jgi:hypothetical protein